VPVVACIAAAVVAAVYVVVAAVVGAVDDVERLASKMNGLEHLGSEPVDFVWEEK
jgi:hypothetical protein